MNHSAEWMSRYPIKREDMQCDVSEQQGKKWLNGKLSLRDSEREK
jgi:hypothetical protein